MKKYTIEDFRLYLLNQDDLKGALFNLCDANIEKLSWCDVYDEDDGIMDHDAEDSLLFLTDLKYLDAREKSALEGDEEEY